MERPLQITFRYVDKTPELEALITRRVEKLERLCDHVIGCRVAVERPHEHEASGNPYRVRIDCTVPPGHELVVTKEPSDYTLSDSLSTVITHAFQAMERQLKELVDKQRGEVKTHFEPHALVSRKFDDAGYGFLRTPNGREIYFHRNAVTHDDFDRLTIGTEVRYEEVLGQEGPQASTVQIVGKPGARLPPERAPERVPGYDYPK
ncbi:MAG TPA: HPF/RaiA family ribosome-associated protein [Polyangiaceae bacterium]|nr:HPF/RaiA family ribosome-associated protein [Polyangiaceae bacterium]